MTRIGDARFARMNQLLNAAFARHTPVIVAHRGTSSGRIPENTADAAHAAFLSGADIVEIDVISSLDGEYFVFHTGTEMRNLGVDTVLEDLTAVQIAELHYHAHSRGVRRRGVERLQDFLSRFRGTDAIFNIDRSWHLWPSLLDVLAETSMADQMLLKCPASEADAIAALAAHETPFPFMLICRSMEDVAVGTSTDGLNLVGVELIAQDNHGPFLDEDQLRQLREQGLFTLANAEVLSDSHDLFAGYDDDVSVAVHPDLGWGRLLDLGVQAIQTDWPWLLREYRRSLREREPTAI